VTGKTIDGISTGQIYMGAIPFVCIQLIMVGLVILFPGMVGHDQKVIPIDKIDIQLPTSEMPAPPPPVKF
jgi:hypothetical protein